MKDFSGKYNYWVLILMLLGLIIFLIIFLFSVANAITINELTAEMGVRVIRGFGYISIVFSSAFFVISIFQGLKRRRFNLFIKNEELILKNIFTGQEDFFKFEKVKGYSTSDILTQSKTYHVVIIYTENGSTYEFPKFMLRNFKELKKAFKIAGFEYLGHEPYTLGWYGKRRKAKFL